MTCADLSRLQRLVTIDFGYRIQFDPRNLKLRDKVSAAYGLAVKIDYTPGEREHKELGWMLYIKLAMMGTEANYVLDYQRENPFFPHQTAADQFFDEAQFEAYPQAGRDSRNELLLCPLQRAHARSASHRRRIQIVVRKPRPESVAGHRSGVSVAPSPALDRHQSSGRKSLEVHPPTHAAEAESHGAASIRDRHPLHCLQFS